MSGYQTYALWGAGHIGGRIADGLLELQAAGTISLVKILTRPESKDNEKNKEFSAKGARIVPYDVYGEGAATALEGIDVLISTVGSAGMKDQLPLIRAAHAAGVKLFVPTEWGDVPDGRPEPLLTIQVDVRTEAANLGLPITSFRNGLWMEYLPNFGFDLKNGKINIQGEGNAQLSTTSMTDVSRFVVHVLTTLPREQLENVSFHIEGDRISMNELAEELQRISTKPLEISHTPRAVFEQRIAENPYDNVAVCIVGWDTGKGALPYPLANEIWPEFKPKKVIEVLKPMLN